MTIEEIDERMNRAHELAYDRFIQDSIATGANAGCQSRIWNELKKEGSSHYKTGGVEPVDLYIAGDMFEDFALCSIIKYAFRSRRSQEINPDLFIKNMNKIIDYSQKLIAAEVCGQNVPGL